MINFPENVENYDERKKKSTQSKSLIVYGANIEMNY
jgi:hypothetical protein